MDSIKKYKLANGLTVLLDSNPAAPVVSVNVGVKVGSANENDQNAGVSHLLEHMVFKGTTTYKPGEIAVRVESSGGELNAYTSFDQTVYYINLSTRHVKTAMNLIREMVFEALIDPVELEREKEVVIEELRRGQDNPHSVLGELLFGLAYTKHPYGRPIIGFEETVRGISRDDVYAYYKHWYSPQNMVLIICGDFNEAEVRAEIEKTFGKYPSHSIQRPTLPQEPESSAPREKFLQKPIQGQYLSLAFPVPPLVHADVPTIDLLAHLLGGSDTSLLEQEVKEKQALVNSISASAYTPRDPGVFMIDADVPSKHMKDIVPAIYAQIETAQTRLFSEEQISRAKHTMKSSIYYEKQTCEGTARKLMSFETTADDYLFEEKYMERLEAVTAHNLREAACRYLKPEVVSLGLVHSNQVKLKSLLKKAPIKKVKSERYKQLKEFEDISVFQLKNGMRIILRENDRLPLISMRHASMGGLRQETARNNGLTYLTVNLLTRGTQTKTALQISELSEEMAGAVSSYVGRNSWGVNASFLSDRKNLGLQLFSDVLQNPAFELDEIKKSKRLTLEAIKNQEDSLAQVAMQRFQALLYQNHPYGLPSLGNKKNVTRFSQEQIRKWYNGLLDPSQMVLACVGDFKTADWIDSIADALENFKGTKRKVQKLKPQSKPKKILQTQLKRNKMQGHMVLGFLANTVYSPDHYALEVLNSVLSGQGGRLFLELRDKQSLAYTVTSMLVEGIEPGYFATYIGSEPQKLPQAQQEILKELSKIRDEVISREELERAQNYIVGNYEIDLQKNANVASVLCFNELYGKELEEFKSYARKVFDVTPEDVQRVAKQYLDTNAYCLSVVQP